MFDEIKSTRIKLADAEKNQMEFKLKLSNIRIGVRKSGKQENNIKNIINLYNLPDEIIKFYKYYSTMMHNARFDATHGKRLKILTPKQMPQRLPIAFTQVKAGNTSENLLKEVRQIIYSLY